MFLSLDLGNSAVKGGLFDGDELGRVFSVGAPGDSAEESDPLHWEEVLAPHLDDVAVEQVGLVSVVPPRTEAVTSALEALTDASVTTVRPEMQLPFTLEYETPRTLGNDRLAAAAAGWVLFGREEPRSVLVVDAGTAVNYEVIHRDGVYQGGAIGVGPALAREALHRGTAQLPDAPLSLPDAPVGRSTRTALQSGVMGGFVESVRGMVDRLAQALPDVPLVVVTGGWGETLVETLDRVDHHAPHLVLQGVRVLATLGD